MPPHPLKSEVAVGVFQLKETSATLEAKTGEGFGYNFGIAGVGNINSLSAPKRLSGPNMNAYDPNVRQQINRGYGRVSGIKEFDYFITFNEPGDYPLQNPPQSTPTLPLPPTFSNGSPQSTYTVFRSNDLEILGIFVKG